MPPKLTRKRTRTSVDTAAKGKTRGGKTAAKGTKPRTVVRGQRGLVPMETDHEGNQHVAGNLPDQVLEQDGTEGTEDEEDEVPLAKRPELDEGERRRREVIKEKAKAKEEEVVSRLTRGANVEDTEALRTDGMAGTEVEVWHGIELVSDRPTSTADPSASTTTSACRY